MAKKGKIPKYTAMQNRFAREFVVDFNGTRAAERAGYSPRSASSTASALLTYPKVQEAIRQAKEELAAKVGITAERTLRERGALAYSDLRKIFDEDSCPIPPHLIPDDIAPAIAAVDIDEKTFTDKDGNSTHTKTYRYKLWDKNRALEALDKHFGLYNADNKQKTSLS
jgi:phage terminase small subunit